MLPPKTLARSYQAVRCHVLAWALLCLMVSGCAVSLNVKSKRLELPDVAGETFTKKVFWKNDVQIQTRYEPAEDAVAVNTSARAVSLDFYGQTVTKRWKIIRSAKRDDGFYRMRLHMLLFLSDSGEQDRRPLKEYFQINAIYLVLGLGFPLVVVPIDLLTLPWRTRDSEYAQQEIRYTKQVPRHKALPCKGVISLGSYTEQTTACQRRFSLATILAAEIAYRVVIPGRFQAKGFGDANFSIRLGKLLGSPSVRRHIREHRMDALRYAYDFSAKYPWFYVGFSCAKTPYSGIAPICPEGEPRNIVYAGYHLLGARNTDGVCGHRDRLRYAQATALDDLLTPMTDTTHIEAAECWIATATKRAVYHCEEDADGCICLFSFHFKSAADMHTQMHACLKKHPGHHP